jgi:arylformamidase
VPIVYDITLVLHEGMAVYPGDAPPKIRRTASIEQGASLTVSTLELPCHAGTHVDAPGHFLAGGRLLSDYPADAFFGPAIVIDVAGHHHVTAAALKEQPIAPRRHLLLRTRNSERPRAAAYDLDHACIDSDAVDVLIALRPLSIGFDDYSVDAPAASDLPVHRRLARAGLLVYVGLDLSAIPAGEYTFFGLPLRLDGAEASPVRAVAVRGE